MSEEKFVDLFKLVEPELQARLRSEGSGSNRGRPVAASAAVGRALEEVVRRYHRSVADADRRTADAKRQHATALLGAVARGFESLNALSLAPGTQRRDPVVRELSYTTMRVSRLAWAGFAAVVLVAGISAVAVSAAAAIVSLGTALIAVVAAVGVKWAAEERRPSRIEPGPAVSVPASFSIDERRISDTVADALLEADEATVQLSRMARTGEASSGGWAGDEGILLTVQGLLGADLQQDSAELRLRIKELRSALLRQGISVVDFDGSNDELFDFERSYGAGVTEPTTLVPALTSRGHALMRGRAIRPSRRPRIQGVMQ